MTTCEYKNDGNIITQPGKFEGEPVFAPYFWDLAMQGFADRGDGTFYTFKFTRADMETGKPFAAELRQYLGRSRTIRMFEDSQGFVRCR